MPYDMRAAARCATCKSARALFATARLLFVSALAKLFDTRERVLRAVAAYARSARWLLAMVASILITLSMMPRYCYA